MQLLYDPRDDRYLFKAMASRLQGVTVEFAGDAVGGLFEYP